MTGSADVRSPALTAAESRWLSSRRSRQETSMDLYCFAHAGGSAGEFMRWSDGLPGVKLWAVRMPGRAPRDGEPPYTRMTELVADLLDQVDFGRRDFAFFGHSLGALVAFEVTRGLRRAGRKLPKRLLLSSMQPPPISTRKGVGELSSEGLLAEIEGRWGALPQEVHDDPELLEIVLGYLRSDAELADSYTYVAEPPLPVPITAFVGSEENRAQLDWQTHTGAEYEAHVLRGGHFYFRDQEQQRELIRLIGRAMTADS
ncbi:thioesterase II family protein [Kitasatospora sp. NPDC094011]|uniref:thioesterase II family protein n=1 Tax=Kitasatospora sp. NPDC094011 TaxID=3364090 RepID=UPI0037FFED37